MNKIVDAIRTDVIKTHNILENGRMLWNSLESQTSINSNISSSDKSNHYSLLFCYLLSLEAVAFNPVEIVFEVFEEKVLNAFISVIARYKCIERYV